jgi:hypothetical protein
MDDTAGCAEVLQFADDWHRRPSWIMENADPYRRTGVNLLATLLILARRTCYAEQRAQLHCHAMPSLGLRGEVRDLVAGGWTLRGDRGSQSALTECGSRLATGIPQGIPCAEPFLWLIEVFLEVGADASDVTQSGAWSWTHARAYFPCSLALACGYRLCVDLLVDISLANALVDWTDAVGCALLDEGAEAQGSPARRLFDFAVSNHRSIASGFDGLRAAIAHHAAARCMPEAAVAGQCRRLRGRRACTWHAPCSDCEWGGHQMRR